MVGQTNGHAAASVVFQGEVMHTQQMSDVLLVVNECNAKLEPITGMLTSERNVSWSLFVKGDELKVTITLRRKRDGEDVEPDAIAKAQPE